VVLPTPVTAAEAARRLREGALGPGDQLQLADHGLWAPAVAWAAIDVPVPPPPRHAPEQMEMPAELAALSDATFEQLRWWLRDGGRTEGPFDGAALIRELEARRGGVVLVALAGGGCWFPREAVDRARHEAWRASAVSTGLTTHCQVCLEEIPVDAQTCPECAEPLSEMAPVPSAPRPRARVSNEPPVTGLRWLKEHWRPMVTLAAVGGLLGFGVALRHLAPERYQPPEMMPAGATAIEAACEDACWHGESCQMGRCVWQSPNDVGHVATKPEVDGPFELPADVTDVLPLDAERYAAANLRGIHVMNARTGGLLTTVSEAPQAQRMFRVGDTVYATSPRRIYVVTQDTVRVLKTIELGTSAHDLVVGASGQRVLASLPGAKAVAVIATDYHAEVARFFFGDDNVREVALDDTGSRALTTNGRIPLAGFSLPRALSQQGAMYAFDPSRLPSEQDRVRTALVGNPVDVILAPDNQSSFALLREEDAIVHLESQPSGAVRQEGRLATCRQPEKLELIRRGRRGLVRCNQGKAVEVIDLDGFALLKHIPLSVRATDAVVTPDGQQAILALPPDGEDKKGAIGVLDLSDYQLTLHEVEGKPQRVRITPDGRTAVVISEGARSVWVLR
ncbi:MAG: hypothetical protein KC731_00500, partial [Myxococcales bacterium]|nr:hypothetical protein [Myxococcales bacterium]